MTALITAQTHKHRHAPIPREAIEEETEVVRVHRNIHPLAERDDRRDLCGVFGHWTAAMTAVQRAHAVFSACADGSGKSPSASGAVHIRSIRRHTVA